jgi:hypothetical protein
VTISATRRSILPVEHLEAELLAAPFSSRVAFSNCLVGLDPRIRAASAALWREQEVTLLSRFPGMSVDELIIRRDRIWFGDPTIPANQSRSLLDVLRSATREREHSASIDADSRPSDVERRRTWRWTTFALPVDLLLATVNWPEESTPLICSSLRHMLEDRGVAESHLHLKAAMEFPLLWAALQRALAEPGITDTMCAGPAAEFDEGRDLTPWLVRCALARLVLAAFLNNRSGAEVKFQRYLRERAVHRVARLEGNVLATLFSRAIDEVGTGRLSENALPFERLRALYASLIRLDRGGRARGGDPVARLDPIAAWFPASRGAHPEFRFLRAAFAYLESPNGSGDDAFKRLFWQVERLRVFFYRHIVQRPMIPGLQWFTRTYDRLGAPRRPLSIATFVDRAVRLSGAGLRSLEVRIAPGNSISELKQGVDAIDRAAKRHDPLELGIVYHFIRSRGPDAQRGEPQPWNWNSHDDPRSRARNPHGYRFSGYYLERRLEAAALANLLLTYPRMLERVRGLDLCTDELGVPLWVLLPLVKHVRRAGRLAAQALRGSTHPVQPLRLTVHAGEDFVHLLGSIRRVGEAVDYLRLSEGDRIGHGVSLGVNVDEWAARSTGLAIPRGERLFDLIWAWRCAMRSTNDVLRAWLSWLGQEACRLARAIFGREHSAVTLDALATSLHSTNDLARAGFPSGPAPQPTDNVDQLLLAWLRDRRVFERAQMLERIDVGREAALVSALQAHVRSLLTRAGIVVEINPSSNLLIGHLGDLTDHPLWRLCPPIESAGAPGHVRVCIGSDDPITFATKLPDEYQLLADAMIEGGLSMPQVDTWLERARAVGMASRFTVPASGRRLTSPVCFRRLPLPL